LNFFIFNLSCFLKNKWSNQNFREMYILRRTPRRQAPAAAPRGVKSLPPRGPAAGAWFQRQGGAARRQDPAVERHGGRVFFIFLVFHF
jgi:hypothetical protein